MPAVSDNRPQLIFASDPAPLPRLARVFVATAVACWFIQAGLIAVDHWWPQVVPRPIVGILLWPSGVSEKVHWPIVLLFSCAFAVTSVVYAAIITSVLRWWMVADDRPRPTLP